MAPPASRERAKIAAVIGLSILFLIVGYFRFIHGKMAFSSRPAQDGGLPVGIEVPAADIKGLLALGQIPAKAPEPPRAALRNIFAPVFKAPGAGTSPVMPAPEPLKPIPSLKLTGTIIGGKRPMAVINDRFMWMGDRIEGWQVASITRNQVVLAADGRKIVLNVLESPESVKQ